jgi:alpha-L-rhamnosidase
VTVPTNTSATIYVPAKDVADVTESGQPIEQVKEVTFLRMEAGAAVFEVGSGMYAFSATMN